MLNQKALFLLLAGSFVMASGLYAMDAQKLRLSLPDSSSELQQKSSGSTTESAQVSTARILGKSLLGLLVLGGSVYFAENYFPCHSLTIKFRKGQVVSEGSVPAHILSPLLYELIKNDTITAEDFSRILQTHSLHLLKNTCIILCGCIGGSLAMCSALKDLIKIIYSNYQATAKKTKADAVPILVTNP